MATNIPATATATATTEVALLDFDGTSSKNCEEWLKTMESYLKIAFGDAAAFTSNPECKWEELKLPTKPKIKPHSEGMVLVFDDPTQAKGRAISEEEGETLVDAYLKSSRRIYANARRSPRWLRLSSPACLLRPDPSSSAVQTSRRMPQQSPDPVWLWKTIQETCRVVRTGAAAEDVVANAAKLFTIQQRPNETLSALKDRIAAEVRNVNALLKVTAIPGAPPGPGTTRSTSTVGPMIAAAVFLRALDPSIFGEPRKSIVNSAVQKVRDYPASLEEAFDLVSKWRVSAPSGGDTQVIGFGSALVMGSSIKAKAEDGKGKDKDKRKDKRKGKESSDSKEDKPSDSKETSGDSKVLRHRSGEPVKCSVPGCGGNHWRYNCPIIKKAVEELGAEEELEL